MYSQSFQASSMVIVNLQSCHSLVSSRRCSFGLFIHSLFSSLPVPFPAKFRLLNYPLFSSHPIPFPNNICVFISSLIYSLPVPFPIISVLLFVLICWISTYACPRLRLQHIPLVLQPRDSRTRPSPISRTWILDYRLPAHNFGLCTILWSLSH